MINGACMRVCVCEWLTFLQMRFNTHTHNWHLQLPIRKIKSVNNNKVEKIKDKKKKAAALSLLQKPKNI